MDNKRLSLKFDYNYPQIARDSGFCLHQYKDGPLDWRLMGNIETERIIRDQSFEQIDGIMSYLAEAPLASLLESSVLDSGIAKYFTLSQFSIQYLLFCREFLEETVKELRDSYAESQMDVTRLKKSLNETNNEIVQLQKRASQMEAIREVVFPCHLCPKNFISNDALNVHLGMKHKNQMPHSSNKNRSISAQSDKEFDMSLINTIKLELEIKHLKERLNQAEREIREHLAKNDSPPDSDRFASGGATSCKSYKSVAIQSNLCESKEMDDSCTADSMPSLEEAEKALTTRRRELGRLQEKINEFEEWKNEQQLTNEECLSEINRKLADLSIALEGVKYTKEISEPETMLSKNSTSIENLERILSEKVEEIGKASAEKMQELIYTMEMSYRVKLDDLEREMKKQSAVLKTREQEILAKNSPMAKFPEEGEESIGLGTAGETSPEQPTNFHTENVKNILTTAPSGGSGSGVEPLPVGDITIVSSEEPSARRSKRSIDITDADESEINDNTFEIEDMPTKIENIESGDWKAKTRRIESDEILLFGSEESFRSNRSFVQTGMSERSAEGTIKERKINDETDVSLSLSEDETQSENESEASAQSVELLKGKFNKTSTPRKSRTPKKPNKSPRKFLRDDACKLANKNLLSLGLNMKTKRVSSAAMKRVNEAMTEERNKLKEQYPNFYATRNRIKKFVDKLCSSKLPPDAENILKATAPLKPIPKASKVRYPSDNIVPIAVPRQQQLDTPKSVNPKVNDDFKQRLDRILASPMRKPENYRSTSASATTTAADVHMIDPVPMPRKRVMFNTAQAGKPPPTDNSHPDAVVQQVGPKSIDFWNDKIEN